MINLTQKQFTEVIENQGFRLEEGTQSDSMELEGRTVNFDLDLVSFTVDNKVWFTFSAFQGNKDNLGFWKFEGRQNVWTKGRNDKTWKVEQRAEDLLGL
jgi:hypothetical protein|tara:strand:- start:209 stop:505 length:297 start_codon:yes stop_codon:yes gene_type:complete